MKRIVLIFSVYLSFTGCSTGAGHKAGSPPADKTPLVKVITGAEQLNILMSELKGKNIALVVNYTATVGKTHLADTLKSLGISVKKIMSPEHGFRGNAAAGEHVKDGIDMRTGLPVVSLYGCGRLRYTGYRCTILHLSRNASLCYGSMCR